MKQIIEAARTLRTLLELIGRTPTETDTEAMLRDVDDEHLRTMVRASAEAFRMLRTEAQRRGIWEALLVKPQ
jgi:hypothetical protein